MAPAKTIQSKIPPNKLYAEAIRDFGKGRALAPMDETFPLELGLACDDLERFPEAEWMFYEARRPDPVSESLKQYCEAHLTRGSGRRTGNVQRHLKAGLTDTDLTSGDAELSAIGPGTRAARNGSA